MLKKNDEVTLEIERFGGEMGIAHLDGITLFVQGALPGEQVVARAQRVEKTHAFLKTLRVLKAAPSRVAPPCPYYERCGGCVCQHMTYETSLQPFQHYCGVGITELHVCVVCVLQEGGSRE